MATSPLRRGGPLPDLMICLVSPSAICVGAAVDWSAEEEWMDVWTGAKAAVWIARSIVIEILDICCIVLLFLEFDWIAFLLCSMY